MYSYAPWRRPNLVVYQKEFVSRRTTRLLFFLLTTIKNSQCSNCSRIAGAVWGAGLNVIQLVRVKPSRARQITQHPTLLDYKFISALICNKKNIPSPPHSVFHSTASIDILWHVQNCRNYWVSWIDRGKEQKQNKNSIKSELWLKKSSQAAVTFAVINLHREHRGCADLL